MTDSQHSPRKPAPVGSRIRWTMESGLTRVGRVQGLEEWDEKPGWAAGSLMRCQDVDTGRVWCCPADSPDWERVTS